MGLVPSLGPGWSSLSRSSFRPLIFSHGKAPNWHEHCCNSHVLVRSPYHSVSVYDACPHRSSNRALHNHHISSYLLLTMPPVTQAVRGHVNHGMSARDHWCRFWTRRLLVTGCSLAYFRRQFEDVISSDCSLMGKAVFRFDLPPHI